MIGGIPDKAVLIPAPIPFAAVDMAVPADLTILPKPLKIWLIMPPLLLAPLEALSVPSLALFPKRPNLLPILSKKEPMTLCPVNFSNNLKPPPTAAKVAIQLCNLPGSILPTTSAIAFAKLDTCFTIPPTIEPKFFQLPPLIALATFFNAPQTLFKAPEKALIAPVCLKPSQNSLIFETTDEMDVATLEITFSMLIPSRNFPMLLANREKSTLSNCSAIDLNALIPN